MGTLTTASLRRAAIELAAADPDLGASYARWGPPPLWARDASYATLVHLILEQQVSLASALAAFTKLQVAIGEVTPTGLLTLDDDELRTIGFSRQKAGYARDLARAMLDGLDLAALAGSSDDDVRAQLMSQRGIGRWTSDIYLIMCLRRPDVWPYGDQALATSARDVFAMVERPSFAELAGIAERWHPHRATAARMLWQDYLRRRGLPVD